MKDTSVVILGGVEDSSLQIPLYGSRPQAGFASVGDDHIEKVLDINDLVVKHPASTFFVRVEGVSMIGAGIFSGDVLVVDRSLNAKSGSIVVAAINGEMLVKRLFVQGGLHTLHSENADYAPITISEHDDGQVWGVVVGSVRRFE